MTNTKTLSALTLTLALAAACGGDLTDSSSTTALDTPQIEQRLSAAAAELAPLLGDDQLRAGLAAALGKRRTGDYEVLLKDARDLPLRDGRTLGDALRATGILEVELAQLATPGGVPNWATAPEVLVTWAPIGVEKGIELEFYHADGRVHRAPAGEPPRLPVVVLGLNERTRPPSPGPAAQGIGSQQHALSATCAAPYCREVWLNQIKIEDDHEPWYKGDPEIYMMCLVPGYSIRDTWVVYTAKLDLASVNSENKWYTVNKPLLELKLGQPTDCYVMEADEGRTSPVDSDDVLGSVTLYFEVTANTHTVADAVFTTR